MVKVYLLVFGHFAAGIILALVWWLIRGHKDGRLVGAVGRFTIAGGLLALLGEVAVRLIGVQAMLPFDVPPGFWYWYSDNRYSVPLVLGILGVVLLTFPVQSRSGQGTADLVRRTPASFIRLRWLAAPTAAIALVILITFLAGNASRPDSEMGQYTTYAVEPGAQLNFGTGIYGWFYSVPAMILAVVLIAVATMSLFLIARPAVAEDRERDIRERTIRTRNIISAATGALFIQLGLIFRSLALTSSLRGEFPTPGGLVTVSPPFSAFGPAFDGAFILCSVFGVALWATVVLTAVPSRHSMREATKR